MVEVRCPSCRLPHWEIDCDYRGSQMLGKKELSYRKRTYFCPHCKAKRTGYAVLQKSPPEFFLQPHQVYPMSETEFDRWAAVLKQNFPNYSKLSELGKSWHPAGGGGRLLDHAGHWGQTLSRAVRMRLP